MTIYDVGQEGQQKAAKGLFMFSVPSDLWKKEAIIIF